MRDALGRVGGAGAAGAPDVFEEAIVVVGEPIERTSPGDLLALASGSTDVPMQFAAVLILDRPVDLGAVRQALVDRIPAVPRLRQRLQRTPFGGGRPVWVDDTDFRIEHHLREVMCPEPGDETALFAVATAAAMRRLPTGRPLWSMTVVDRMSDGRGAVVVVMHHVVADGIGGLAVLAQLVDGAPATTETGFPATALGPRALIAAATRARLAACRQLPARLRFVADAVVELRLGRLAHPARTSLNRPTGSHRQLAVARADLGGLVAAAHRHGVTINDLLLTAIGGALAAVLSCRGEHADSAVVAVSVSARRSARAGRLGNEVGVMLVEVPLSGSAAARLARVAQLTRHGRATPGRGASAVLLGPLFRLLAQLGMVRRFVDRQRLVTTMLTNLKGPQRPLRFVGAEVVGIVPITIPAGNVTVTFAALSCAGTMVVSVIADPVCCPDLTLLVTELQRQLDTSCATTDPVSARPSLRRSPSTGRPASEDRT